MHIDNVLFLSTVYLKSLIFGETRKERNETAILFLYFKIEPQGSPSLESMFSHLGSESVVHTIPNFRLLNTGSASTRQKKKENTRVKAIGKQCFILPGASSREDGGGAREGRREAGS